jgi:hypothetical protein
MNPTFATYPRSLRSVLRYAVRVTTVWIHYQFPCLVLGERKRTHKTISLPNEACPRQCAPPRDTGRKAIFIDDEIQTHSNQLCVPDGDGRSGAQGLTLLGECPGRVSTESCPFRGCFVNRRYLTHPREFPLAACYAGICHGEISDGGKIAGRLVSRLQGGEPLRRIHKATRTLAPSKR